MRTRHLIWYLAKHVYATSVSMKPHQSVSSGILPASRQLERPPPVAQWLLARSALRYASECQQARHLAGLGGLCISFLFGGLSTGIIWGFGCVSQPVVCAGIPAGHPVTESQIWWSGRGNCIVLKKARIPAVCSHLRTVSVRSEEQATACFKHGP
jgi:hypothetical protein